MSKTYSIDIQLDAQYDTKNIKKILNNAIKKKIILHKYIWEELNVTLNPMNIDDATESIMQGDDNNLHNINLQVDDTFLTLSFRQHEGKLIFMALNFNYPWLKKFGNDEDEDLDIGKYAKIMLDLVEGIRILEMWIVKD